MSLFANFAHLFSSISCYLFEHCYALKAISILDIILSTHYTITNDYYNVNHVVQKVNLWFIILGINFWKFRTILFLSTSLIVFFSIIWVQVTLLQCVIIYRKSFDKTYKAYLQFYTCLSIIGIMLLLVLLLRLIFIEIMFYHKKSCV